MKMRTAIYARISRDPDEQREGVERQVEAARRHAEAQGWEIIQVFEDNDASGFRNSERRPGFAALKEAIRAGEIDAVVVQHQDRLARHLATFAEFAELCRVHDVRIEPFSGAQIDLKTASGRFQSQIQASVDEHYSGILSEKISAAVEERARKGLPTGGGAGGRPFGYERDQVTIVPREAQAIRDMADRFLGGESLRSIAFWMNEQGFTTTAGNPWGNRRVRDTLLNPRYAGLRIHQGEIIGEAVWPSILDRDTWEIVQSRLLNRTREPVVRTYLLTGGIAQCGKCGHPLVSGQARGNRRYICPATTEGGCGGTAIGADPLERLVAEAMLEALHGAGLAAALGEATDAERGDLARELRGVELQLEDLITMWASGQIDRGEYLSARAILNERKQALEVGLRADDDAAVLSALPDSEAALREAWGTASLDWKRAVVQAVVERVVIGPAVRGRNFFDPDRVAVEWRA
jgi:DNA invertase Pin-like site-specific DNA recombinase